MKIFHVADLHIGKKIHEFNLLADQVFILKQMVALAVREQPDVLIIAGDVYDKAIPPAEAVMAFDEFLTDLAANQVPVLLIAGNHDSPERLHFGGRIMAKSQIFPMGVFGGGLVKHTFYDDYGPVHFWLLPFVKPGQVRRFFPEQNIDSYQDAVAAVLAAAKLDNTCRNLLVAHQFVIAGGTEPLRSESETITIGGLDQVDAAVFGDFDYVALGHLHRSQAIGGEQIRYAGSPLKYSFSEARQEKSLTMVELGCKGELHICQLPLQPLHDMREIKGS
ncbi:MAG: exonuclease SbcCD subunit D, partial [Clostridiales bacterium]